MEKVKYSIPLLSSCAVIVLCIAIALPGFAAADDILVSPNRGLREDIFANPSTDSITTFFEQDRSYSCVLIVREFDPALPKKFPVFNTNLTAPDASTVVADALGTMKPAVAVPSSLVSKQSLLRLSLIAPQSGRYTIGLDDGQPGGTAVPGTNIRCNDTTLYGGFNRFFADIAIVELSNDTAENIEALITIIDFSGTKLIDKQSVTVSANKRADVVFASLPAQRFGQVLIAYKGSVTALSGYVSEYDLAADNTLTLKRERPLAQGASLP